MQTIRSNLTRLKTLVEKNLPDGEDIFGYAGISKKMLIEFVDSAYAFSYELGNVEPKFEITILKRKVSSLIEQCKDYLNNDASGFLKDKKFDVFLSNLTEIRGQIRMTYILVVDKSLRKEEEVAIILESYEKLKDSYEQFEEKFQTVDESLQRVSDNNQKIEDAKNKIQVILEEAKKNSEDIFALTEAAEANGDAVEKYEDEARSKKEFLIESSTKLTSLISKANEINDKSEAVLKKIESLSQQLQSQLQLNAEKQKEIQDTLGNANRVGMAGSFKIRKEELNNPILMWGVIFTLAIILIFAVAAYFIAPVLTSGGDIVYGSILTKMLLATPFVWLAWMSAKQYGYLSRIREDYAYKYASAMAFEGYKKHAVEAEEELLYELLSISIVNLSQNPIRLFRSNDNHASPVHELIKEVFERVSKKKASEDEG